MKQYKNSKGEDLPKEINEVVNAENERLDSLKPAIYFLPRINLNYFKEDNFDNWCKVWNGDYLQFYLEYKFKNAKGQIFPDEIQNEIYEEIKRQGVDVCVSKLPFSFGDAEKQYNYWNNLYMDSDYSQSNQPFIPNSGDMVEVSDSDDLDLILIMPFYQYHPNLKKPYLTLGEKGDINNWETCRPIKTKVTIAELLEFYATAKGLNIDNLEQI